MKFLFWLVILAVLGGALWYQFSYKPEQEKKAKIELAKKAEAEKAKLETEKKEAEAKAQEEKKAEAKLAEEKKAETEKKVEVKSPETPKPTVDNSAQIKKNNAQIVDIKKAIENFKPETCKLNPALCQKCTDLQAKMSDILKQQNDKKKSITDAQSAQRSESGTMRSARSVKDAKGWHWKDESDSVCRPMRDLPKHRTKGVEYVFAKDDRGEKAAAEVQKKIDALNVEVKKLDEQYNSAKVEYQQISVSYKAELEKKLADLTNENKKIAPETLK